MMKRYIATSQSIALHDLLDQETDRVVTRLTDNQFQVSNYPGSHRPSEEVAHRVREYEAITATLQALTATGCYWISPEHERLIVRCINRIEITARTIPGNMSVGLWYLRQYPALLLMYCGGIAAIEAEKYWMFAALMLKPDAYRLTGNGIARTTPLEILQPGMVLPEYADELPNATTRAPISEHLYHALREPLRSYIPDDEQYSLRFDEFEYLCCLMEVDLGLARNEGNPSWRWGRFLNRSNPLSYPDPMKNIIAIIDSEVARHGATWLPIEAGLFGGSPERFAHARDHLHEVLQPVWPQLRW